MARWNASIMLLNVEIMLLFHCNMYQTFQGIHLVLLGWKYILFWVNMGPHRCNYIFISFHYPICRFKWHICIPSAQEHDTHPKLSAKMLPTYWELSVGFCRNCWAVLCWSHLIYVTCWMTSAKLVDSSYGMKNSQQGPYSLNSGFLSDQRMTNVFFHSYRWTSQKTIYWCACFPRQGW